MLPHIQLDNNKCHFTKVEVVVVQVNKDELIFIHNIIKSIIFNTHVSSSFIFDHPGFRSFYKTVQFHFCHIFLNIYQIILVWS